MLDTAVKKAVGLGDVERRIRWIEEGEEST